MRQAAAAKVKGEWAKARALYTTVVERNPSDSEALAGLGEVSRGERDLVGAQAFFRRALAVNPTYLPAMVGLGDALWEGGDRAGAAKAYREIVERIPEGAYPVRVRQRLDPDAPSSHGAATATTTQPAPSATDEDEE